MDRTLELRHRMSLTCWAYSALWAEVRFAPRTFRAYRRQLGSYPETGLEEMREQAIHSGDLASSNRTSSRCIESARTHRARAGVLPSRFRYNPKTSSPE
jgi:hypothetical protein